jgi:hypothetical protein
MRIFPFAALTVCLCATTAIAQTDLAPSANVVTGPAVVNWTASVDRTSLIEKINVTTVSKRARANMGAKRCQARKRHCTATGRRQRVEFDGPSTPYNLPPNLGFGFGTGL